MSRTMIQSSRARILTALTAAVAASLFALATVMPIKATSADDRIKTVDKFFKVEEGESLTWRCTLRNTTNQNLKFNLRVKVVLKNGKTSDDEAILIGLLLPAVQMKSFSGKIQLKDGQSNTIADIVLSFEEVKVT